MSPPARRECAPIRSGSMPCSCILSDFVAVCTHCTISGWEIAYQTFGGVKTSQNNRWSDPAFDRIWCTLRASAASAPSDPVDSWWRVCPMRPFFWFVIFNVAESAWSKICNGQLRFRIFLSRKKPTSQTRNWRVRVAGTHTPFFWIFLAFVYSPLLSK